MRRLIMEPKNNETMEEKYLFELSKEKRQWQADTDTYKSSIADGLERMRNDIKNDLESAKKPNKIKNFFNRLFQTWG